VRRLDDVAQEVFFGRRVIDGVGGRGHISLSGFSLHIDRRWRHARRCATQV
jgi:hypothetical protein